jgi:hypothetical protein
MRAQTQAFFLAASYGSFADKDTGELLPWGAVELAFNFQDEPKRGRYGFEVVRCKCTRELAESLHLNKAKPVTLFIADLELKPGKDAKYRCHGLEPYQSK